MEDYTDPIRDAFEKAILEEAAGLEKIKVGSEDRKRSVDCLATLAKVYHDDCRLGGQLLKDQEEMELAKKRYIDESLRADRELDLKEGNAVKAGKWYNQPIVEKILVCGTSIGTLGLCMVVNSGMNPLKGTLERFIFFVKPKI